MRITHPTFFSTGSFSMLVEIERFVNWVRRRSPQAHTWQDYRCDLNFFMASVGDRKPGAITFQDIDRFIGEHKD